MFLSWKWRVFSVACAFLIGLSFPKVSFAYFSNMDASVVIGQDNFVTNTAGTSQTKLSVVIRGVFVDPKGRLIVADMNNNRVLIWNTVPTTNGTPADLVLGQPDFTSNTSSNGGQNNNNFAVPNGIFSTGDKLIVSEDLSGTSRVMIWNTFPTRNMQPADVVVGQSSFTSSTLSCDSTHTQNPQGVFVYNNKLIVAVRGQHRVLIWNNIPTTNGAPADIALGQPDLTHCSALTNSASSLRDPRAVVVSGNGKLFVGDRGNNRILVWNTIPTTSGAPADYVIGQPDFSSGTSSVGNNTVAGLVRFFATDKRLFVPSSNRLVIFNNPGASYPTGDILLGQTSFTSSSANGGGAVSARGFSGANAVFEYQDKLLVADEGNARILIFNNVTEMPGIQLNNSPESREGTTLRLAGTASTTSPYTVNSIQYAVNRASFANATPSDGGFNSNSEKFYFDFDPTANQPRDAAGNFIEGYTVLVKGTNSNKDSNDHTFFFSPFTSNSPSEGEAVKSSYPTFDFSVNKQREVLRDNLDHYAVQVRDRSAGEGWKTVIENIPVDFASHKGDEANLQRSIWENLGVTEGAYETETFLATYSDGGSRLKVRSKTTPLSGSYEWKVVAYDKSGHTQETSGKNILVAGNSGRLTAGFPLAILNITGLGNPYISSYNLPGIKSTYYTTSSAPTFYGIAWGGSTVTLNFTEQECTENCTHTYTSVADFSSRFGLNVTKGELKRGKKYDVTASVALDTKFTQLPMFSLQIK